MVDGEPSCQSSAMTLLVWSSAPVTVIRVVCPFLRTTASPPRTLATATTPGTFSTAVAALGGIGSKLF